VLRPDGSLELLDGRQAGGASDAVDADTTRSRGRRGDRSTYPDGVLRQGPPSWLLVAAGAAAAVVLMSLWRWLGAG
jgi:hypothetical protein